MYTIIERDGMASTIPMVSPGIPLELPNLLPGIEAATRLINPPEVDIHLVRYEDKVFYEKRGVLVDSTFLDVFPYPLKEGNPQTALDEPSTVLLSEDLAQKIFPNRSALDELVIITSGHTTDTFRVTGVIKKTPHHSHIDADIYMCMNSRGWGRYVMTITTWAWNNFAGGYLKLRPGVTPESIASQFAELIEQRDGEALRNAGLKKDMGLQALADVHLYSDFGGELLNDGTTGRIVYVYILGSIGIFILLLACINFMNLTTAKASQRAGEVGIRKAMGAQRGNLFRQFMGESMTVVFVALILSLALVFGALPFINQITGKDLTINSANITFLLAAMVVTGLVTGVLAGSYPALFLSAFDPVRVLKNKNLSGDGSQWLRKSLVVFQFIIAITLISSIIIVQQQLHYIQNKPLGFNSKHVVMVPLRSKQAGDKFLTLRNEWKQIAGVKEVSATTSLPSTPLFRDFMIYPQGSTMERAVLHRNVFVDENYFKTLDIKFLAGRDFIAEQDTFSFRVHDNKIIVNEACLRSLDIPLEKAIGFPVFTEWEGVVRRHEIIGVVQDFHQFSLHQPIQPMVFALPYDRSGYVFMTASLEGNDYASILEQMRERWESVVKDAPFESQFLDDSLNLQYEADQKILLMLAFSTSLALLICCLGLYGLSVYVAGRRFKEIGIRKVLGASVFNIVAMLSRDFIRLVLIAFVIAVPLGYYLMDHWLQNFTYRIEIGYSVFILAGILSFLIAWLTVGFESFRAAISNPTKAIRNE